MSNLADDAANDVSATGNSLKSSSAAAAPAQKSMPTWFVAGIFGVLIGGGGGFLLAMYGYGHRVKVINTPAGAGENYGKPPVMDAALGGASGKRDLGTLVGKIELLSRPDLKLALAFEGEQQAKLAAELTALKKAETMSDEDAQQHLDAIAALLTPEQKTAISAISLPRRQSGAGGPPAGGAAIGGGAMGAGPMGGMAGGAADGNPFAQDETNQQRLEDLLSRLQGAGEPAASETGDQPAP